MKIRTWVVKLFDFYGNGGPCRNLDKGNSSSKKKKRKQCVAFGCSNTFYGPNGLPSSLHFFKFPKNTNRRRQWYNLIKRQHGKDGFFVTNSTVVCSKHFRKEDIRKTLTGRWELESGLSSKDYILLSLHFLLITLISISPPHCFYRILCLLVALFQLIFQ